MRAIAYYRKSTDGFDRDGNVRQEGSHDRQRKAVREFAERNGLQIIPGGEIVEAKSGKTVRTRDAFQEIVEEVKRPNKRFDAIIFDDPSRFMRNVRLAREYEEIFRRYKVKIYFLNLNNDGGFGDGLTLDLLCRMAEMFSRDHARKVLGGVIRKAEKCSWLGGTAPYGYRTQRDDQNIVRLVIHDEEAKIVREIFHKSAEGFGHKRIAVELNERGIPGGRVARERKGQNRNRDGKWSCDGVRTILRNVAYKGTYRWNRGARVDCFDWEYENGMVKINDLRSELDEFRKDKTVNLTMGALPNVYINRDKPKDEWFQKEGAVPAIVTKEIFDRVQERFRKFAKRRWLRKNTHRYLMVGAIECDTCKNNLHGHRYGKLLKEKDERNFYEYYRCSGDVRKGSHGRSAKPMIRRQAVDDKVIDGMLRRAAVWIGDSSLVRDLFAARVKALMNSGPDRVSAVEKDIRKIDAEIGRMMEAFIKWGHDVNEVEMKKLKVEKVRLEEHRKKLVAAGEGRFHFDVEKQADAAMSRLAHIKKSIEDRGTEGAAGVREEFLDAARIKWAGEDGRPVVELDWLEVPEFIEKRLPLGAAEVYPETDNAHLHVFCGNLPSGFIKSAGRVLAQKRKGSSTFFIDKMKMPQFI